MTPRFRLLCRLSPGASGSSRSLDPRSRSNHVRNRFRFRFNRKASLIREAVVPEVKRLPPLLLVEHFLFGAGPSLLPALGLFLFASTASRYKTRDLRTASSFSCRSRQILSSSNKNSTRCFNWSFSSYTVLASLLDNLR